MKNLLVVVTLCLFTTHGFSQEIAAPQITKEIICRGAAVSVVGGVHPFIKTKTKAEVLVLLHGSFKDPIKDAPAKAYDVLQSGNTKTEVVNVLNTDFLKLEEAVVAQDLINSD